MEDLLKEIQGEVKELDGQLKFGLRILREQGNVGDVIDALSSKLRDRIRRCSRPDKLELFRRMQTDIKI